jgi:hypothetical protein
MCVWTRTGQGGMPLIFLIDSESVIARLMQRCVVASGGRVLQHLAAALILRSFGIRCQRKAFTGWGEGANYPLRVKRT